MSFDNLSAYEIDEAEEILYEETSDDVVSEKEYNFDDDENETIHNLSLDPYEFNMHFDQKENNKLELSKNNKNIINRYKLQLRDSGIFSNDEENESKFINNIKENKKLQDKFVNDSQVQYNFFKKELNIDEENDIEFDFIVNDDSELEMDDTIDPLQKLQNKIKNKNKSKSNRQLVINENNNNDGFNYSLVNISTLEQKELEEFDIENDSEDSVTHNIENNHIHLFDTKNKSRKIKFLDDEDDDNDDDDDKTKKIKNKFINVTRNENVISNKIKKSKQKQKVILNNLN